MFEFVSTRLFAFTKFLKSSQLNVRLQIDKSIYGPIIRMNSYKSYTVQGNLRLFNNTISQKIENTKIHDKLINIMREDEGEMIIFELNDVIESFGFDEISTILTFSFDWEKLFHILLPQVALENANILIFNWLLEISFHFEISNIQQQEFQTLFQTIKDNINVNNLPKLEKALLILLNILANFTVSSADEEILLSSVLEMLLSLDISILNEDSKSIIYQIISNVYCYEVNFPTNKVEQLVDRIIDEINQLNHGQFQFLYNFLIKTTENTQYLLNKLNIDEFIQRTVDNKIEFCHKFALCQVLYEQTQLKEILLVFNHLNNPDILNNIAISTKCQTLVIKFIHVYFTLNLINLDPSIADFFQYLINIFYKNLMTFKNKLRILKIIDLIANSTQINLIKPQTIELLILILDEFLETDYCDYIMQILMVSTTIITRGNLDMTNFLINHLNQINILDRLDDFTESNIDNLDSEMNIITVFKRLIIIDY